MKKLLSFMVLVILSSSFLSVSAYNEIECNSNPVFEENSCNQCFDGGFKGQGDNIGFLVDNWMNKSDMNKILYKEEQVMPEMLNLAGGDVVWSQVPDSESFWEFSSELDSIYNSLDEGYILEPGNTVAWINSKIGYAYSIDKDTTVPGTDIGLLMYTLYTHDMPDIIVPDAVEHKECVLYKSGEPVSNDIPEEPKRLPDTGPKEFIFLFFVALLLGFGLFKMRQKV